VTTNCTCRLTNAFMLSQDVQEREVRGRLSSEVNAERVSGAKLVKAFNQLPMKVLAAPAPDRGRRVVFVASDHADASATVASLVGDLEFAPLEVGRIAKGGRLIQARNALVFGSIRGRYFILTHQLLDARTGVRSMRSCRLTAC
jgi:8-hydroxy-5-deazaflavin:NADPH oxidoreductase